MSHQMWGQAMIHLYGDGGVVLHQVRQRRRRQVQQQHKLLIGFQLRQHLCTSLTPLTPAPPLPMQLRFMSKSVTCGLSRQGPQPARKCHPGENSRGCGCCSLSKPALRQTIIKSWQRDLACCCWEGRRGPLLAALNSSCSPKTALSSRPNPGSQCTSWGRDGCSHRSSPAHDQVVRFCWSFS